MSVNLFTEKDFDRFCDFIGLSNSEKTAREKVLSSSYMPFQCTKYFAEIIANQDEPYKTQLLNIVCPPVNDKPFQGRFDPYGNSEYRDHEVAFIQHKYLKTLLLHFDDYCISNCQFCYKVNEIRDEELQNFSIEYKLQKAVNYLKKNKEIDNILFSGGDPVSFRKPSDIINILNQLITVENIRFIRIATKALSYAPNKLSDSKILEFFHKVENVYKKQIIIIAQFNHPAEITSTAKKTIDKLSRIGIQLRGQPALVKGVNDSVSTLIELQRKFIDNKIVPYYLTVFMPVKGVEQYALKLHEAFRLVASSKKVLNGLDKKGVLLASHDFGKFEICGFYPSSDNPKKIILKWHQAAKPEFLPEKIINQIPYQPEDIIILKYNTKNMYCIDHVFRANSLPYFLPSGRINNQD